MSGRRLPADRDFLVRDLVRDYCTVHGILADQRRRFETDGAVSYSALCDLLGEAMRKGVFWRLKDTAHHLFRNRSDADADAADAPLPDDFAPDGLPQEDARRPRSAAERTQMALLQRRAGMALPGGAEGRMALEALIDWCIGYAFHECVKLKEDAFQGQHYANRLIQISRYAGVTAEMYNPLRGLGGQTSESSSRELARIMHVLGQGLRLLARYLAMERHNTHLARWLACGEAVARQAFGESYTVLLSSLFGGDRERLYLMAARDFLEAGRREPAAVLLAGAQQDGLLGAEGLALLRELEATAADGAACGVCDACDKKQGMPCLPSCAEGGGRGRA